MISGKIETPQAFALFFTLVLGFFTFINWTNQQYDLISNISPSSQLAQVFTQPDPAQNLLIIYNSNPLVPESVELKDYYLANRPGIANANVLGINVDKTATAFDYISKLDYISETDFNSIIRAPIVAWLQANSQKPIRYIVMMYGLPTRVPGGSVTGVGVESGSVDYRISRAFQSLNLRTGEPYDIGALYPAQIFTHFTPEYYQGTIALVTRMDMGTVAATKAYIDKLVAMYNKMPSPNIIISAENTGTAGNTYYFDDAQGYNNAYNGKDAQTAVLNENPSALTVYAPTGSPRTSGVHIYNASNVKGYMTWGANGYLGPDYANNRSIKFSGNSGWYILQTIESWNGQRVFTGCPDSCQGNFVDWFSSNAFGGTNYENTPVGAVTHVEEPGLSGVNLPQYFSLWERGYLFIEAAWASRATKAFMAIGDPLVRSSASEIPTPPPPTVTFTASPTSITSGSSATLTWSSINAFSSTNALICLATEGVDGAFGGMKTKSGTETVSPTADTTYSITCKGPGGSSPVMTASVKVITNNPILPVISSISASPVTTTGTTISWSVNKPATSQVLYGLTILYGSNTSISSSNTQTLSGLIPNTVYHYQIKSTDATGNIATSSDNIFTTAVQPINSTITITTRFTSYPAVYCEGTVRLPLSNG